MMDAVRVWLWFLFTYLYRVVDIVKVFLLTQPNWNYGPQYYPVPIIVWLMNDCSAYLHTHVRLACSSLLMYLLLKQSWKRIFKHTLYRLLMFMHAAVQEFSSSSFRCVVWRVRISLVSVSGRHWIRLPLPLRSCC